MLDRRAGAHVFDGWVERPSITSVPTAPVMAAVAPAWTLLLTTGWRRHDLPGIRKLPQHRKHAGRSRRNLANSGRRAASR
ncbi:MAG: hypothetical protein JNM84_17615 [Planctomycetes bacterium]|nr:hypothetical protein [Planctomycetota bacterium]